MNRGLYIHIPFCKTRCHYCDFVTIAETVPELRERFFKALFAEIKHMREDCRRIRFETLYFGGGTPSCLSIPELERLTEEIGAAFKFKGGFEFTVEFNPGDGDAEKLRSLQRLGVNRVSLGCQAFQDRVLKRLGRRHTVRKIEKTVAGLREAGISNISFDLMLRVPGQTVESFRESVRRSIELEASQVSLYDLEVHESTVFGRSQKEGRLDLPEETEHVLMYEAAIGMLTAAGYEHYEISNFAKPGMASRHNLIYWRNQEYLGLGPGAFTYLDGVRSQFAADLPRYIEKCEGRDWKNDVEDRLSETEKEIETLAMGLRLREGVVLKVFPRIYSDIKPRFETLCAEGLMEKARKNVRLTLRGKSLPEDVFGYLLERPSIKDRL